MFLLLIATLPLLLILPCKMKVKLRYYGPDYL